MSRKRNISGLFFYRQNNALVRESVRDDVHIYIYIYIFILSSQKDRLLTLY